MAKTPKTIEGTVSAEIGIRIREVHARHGECSDDYYPVSAGRDS